MSAKFLGLHLPEAGSISDPLSPVLPSGRTDLKLALSDTGSNQVESIQSHVCSLQDLPIESSCAGVSASRLGGSDDGTTCSCVQVELALCCWKERRPTILRYMPSSLKVSSKAEQEMGSAEQSPRKETHDSRAKAATDEQEGGEHQKND
ncbi:unnamed protein product [Protopolystoma xenopodis]|uniref:Uncharacterized protein n=1 Tax=Protopolystoma xenopodis TaxID=117903 RepID=A0A448XNC8_9PLAT|nr:unnamed protein product [Protopolystoma xenopodis]